VDTTVSHNTLINNTNQSILFDTIINGTSGTFGIFSNKIIVILIACVFAVFIGTTIRRQSRIIMFIFIQGFSFMVFGLNYWAIIMPFMFLISSIMSYEFR
jgi:hypothetical protein